LGGVRTALYAFLLSKKERGDFLLRIEDTDQERFVPGATELIIDTLSSVGLTYCEGPDIGGPVGPYTQSERKEIYQAYIDLLIGRGHAYRCFCAGETLDEQRKLSKASRVPHKYDGRCASLTEKEIMSRLDAGEPFVVRQKIPNGTTVFNDVVYGTIEVDNSTLDDQVLLKSDKMPTYNFANVVDDHLMGISHIVRGNEFLSSTPKYILLYQGFGWDVPEFIHCPPVMRDSQNKLSKRDGDAYFNDFVEKGYLKETIINYVALLGWSPGTEKEKFSMPELIEAFDVRGISKSPAIFDYKKLNWLNGLYLREMSSDEFHVLALPYIKKSVKRDIDTAYVAGVLKERCELLSDIPEQLDFVDSLPDYSVELFVHPKMKTDTENSKEVLELLIPVLEKIDAWNYETVHGKLHEFITASGLKNGRVLWPLRVALSGKTHTPGGGIELSIILGKEETLKRINTAVKKLTK
jgi:glutamyl-tRNA synthetase